MGEIDECFSLEPRNFKNRILLCLMDTLWVNWNVGCVNKKTKLLVGGERRVGASTCFKRLLSTVKKHD